MTCRAGNVPCGVCEVFTEISDDELDFIAKLKIGELRTGPGTTVLREGSPSEQLFTLLEGWAFRYKTLEDGRRQITSFVLPGDLVGIQCSMQGEMDHSVDTLMLHPRRRRFGRDRQIRLEPAAQTSFALSATTTMPPLDAPFSHGSTPQTSQPIGSPSPPIAPSSGVRG